ncbi:hypothetical protein FGO68_gene2879 [Halteria grandinella]|uniref:Fungal lipase-type domain-containing protein n=1 Tax=Halteria grandinella TaxID=5974 RepID=A0A8J8T054_HALGN|nr:hypothetical protein FGO68_gene2879 [Halteria grandinella]
MPSSFIRTASIAIACLIGMITKSQALYNPTMGLQGAQYSAAAYCLYEDVGNWACGPACQANSDLTYVWRVKNPSKASFMFAGYSPSQDQIVVSFRGTNGLDYANWCTNSDTRTKSYPFGGNGKVHSGFFDAYQGLSDLVIQVSRDIRAQYGATKKFFVTGHSLGGALATLAALDIRRQLGLGANEITLYTYGQPRVGDERMADHIMRELPNYIRVTHYDDTVAHVPPFVSGYKHGGFEVWYKSERHDGYYTECSNYAGLSENGQCSNSLWFKTGVTVHLSYLGIPISNNCYRTQPSNTLAEANATEDIVYELVPPIQQEFAQEEAFLN